MKVFESSWSALKMKSSEMSERETIFDAADNRFKV